jgi:DNA-binding LacI/PurR family transcriptional regulator
VGDNRAGGRAVARFLLAGGHRRPAFLAGIEHSSTSRDREAGFTQALREAGLPPPLRAVGQFDPTVARAAAAELLRGDAPPDAIFCANDHMAVSALEVARGMGLTPGRDLSIVGFDDSRPAAWRGVDLTSYSQHAAAMAAAGLVALAALLRGEEAEGATIPGELVVRDTARRPAAGIVEIEGRTVWRG